MSRAPGPNRLRERALHITRKGHAALRSIERGTYEFAPGGKVKAGKRRRRVR
jgi:hypothetical protein